MSPYFLNGLIFKKYEYRVFLKMFGLYWSLRLTNNLWLLVFSNIFFEIKFNYFQN